MLRRLSNIERTPIRSDRTFCNPVAAIVNPHCVPATGGKRRGIEALRAVIEMARLAASFRLTAAQMKVAAVRYLILYIMA
jgi:hypothetical protein